MILRKPYKFLIKHFKIIHLILFLPIIYLILKTNEINKFFSDYISNNYTYSYISNLGGSYINIFMYFAILIIIGITLAIYYLMRQKKKPTKLYIGFIIYYIVLFVSISYCLSILTDLEITQITAKQARTYRDIFFVIFIPQYFMAFFSLFRGLGFDIKQFKFEMDLKELDISAEDNEEFEFVLGVETYKYKRTARRFIREFRYYLLENKFVVSCIFALFILIIGTILFMNFFIYNKTYYKNSKFSHSSFNILLEDSIITNMDYQGKQITKDKYYLVLKLFISNDSRIKNVLDSDNFRLQIDDGYVVPKLDRSSYFIDFGAPYNGGKILSGTKNTYNLVYELNKKQLQSKYKLKILESIDYEVGSITPHYKILSFKPTEVYKKNNKKYNLGDKIDLKSTTIGDAKVKINSYEITNSYMYEYEICKTTCRTIKDIITPGYMNTREKTTLLVLDTSLEEDKDNAYFINLKNKNNFYQHFITIKVNNKEYTVKNVTPSTLKNKVVLQVTENIIDNNFDIVLSIRNNTYTLKAKGD